MFLYLHLHSCPISIYLVGILVSDEIVHLQIKLQRKLMATERWKKLAAPRHHLLMRVLCASQSGQMANTAKVTWNSGKTKDAFNLNNVGVDNRHLL